MNPEVRYKIPCFCEDLVTLAVLADIDALVHTVVLVRIVEDLVLVPLEDTIVYHISLVLLLILCSICVSRTTRGFIFAG